MTHKQTIINVVDELVTIYNKLGGIVDIESIEQGQSIIDAYRHLREAIILLRMPSMTMQKWNYEKRAYEPYAVPSSWHTPIYSFDMGEIVNCPSCGRRMRYGDGYTSKTIHNAYGLGYSVCPSCYDKEIREERAHAKDSD